MKSMDNIKLLFANVASWTGTVLTMKVVEDALRILVPLGSLAVSIASIWWIRRQARSLDKKDAA